MSVDTHIPSGSTQALSFSVWDVLLRLWVAVLLRHTKIDDVDDYVQKYINILPSLLRLDLLFAPLVAGRPIKKLSGFMSR